MRILDRPAPLCAPFAMLGLAVQIESCLGSLIDPRECCVSEPFSMKVFIWIKAYDTCCHRWLITSDPMIQELLRFLSLMFNLFTSMFIYVLAFPKFQGNEAKASCTKERTAWAVLPSPLCAWVLERLADCETLALHLACTYCILHVRISFSQKIAGCGAHLHHPHHPYHPQSTPNSWFNAIPDATQIVA